MANYCCEHMDRASKLDCDIHKDEFACPDVLIQYDKIFDELEAMGYDDPWSQEVPEEYNSSAWYKVT